MDRRIAAFAVDFGTASLFSSVGGQGLLIPLFILTWLGLRVVWVEKNRGQSLGRWLFDIKVADFRLGSTPGLQALFQRESMAGIAALFLLIGLVNLSPTNGFILIAPIPLLADCSYALTDSEYRQAFHDRIARTLMVQTRRGYSLDLKLKKLFAQASRRVK
ncbi:MAG: RDD family protein [Kovacikia sp.]